VAEYTAPGGVFWDKDYVYLGGRLLATETAAGGSSRRYYHPDRLGTRLVSDTSGTPITQGDYLNLPFGTTIAGATDTRRFTSYDRSAMTGQDNAVNRTYSSGHGRFTQADPIGMTAVSLDNPQTLNLFSYCGNDPVNMTDPDGLVPNWVKSLGKVLAKVGKVLVAVGAVILGVAAIVVGQPWAAVFFFSTAASIIADLAGNTVLAAAFGLVAAFGGLAALGDAAKWADRISAVLKFLKNSAQLAGDKRTAGILGIVSGAFDAITYAGNWGRGGSSNYKDIWKKAAEWISKVTNWSKWPDFIQFELGTTAFKVTYSISNGLSSIDKLIKKDKEKDLKAKEINVAASGSSTNGIFSSRWGIDVPLLDAASANLNRQADRFGSIQVAQ
jgi:RHS repeat-associated protein